MQVPTSGTMTTAPAHTHHRSARVAHAHLLVARVVLVGIFGQSSCWIGSLHPSRFLSTRRPRHSTGCVLVLLAGHRRSRASGPEHDQTILAAGWVDAPTRSAD